MLEKLRDGVLEVAFPVVCVSCGTEGKYICEKCEVFLGEASFICPICLRASFAGERHLACQHRHGLNGLASIWEYEGAVQRLLHCIKYDGVVHAIEEIIERACGSMALDQKRFCTFLSFLFSPDTLVTYVPMHSRKEKRRGFNQTELLANALAKQTKSAVACLLEKTKENTQKLNSHFIQFQMLEEIISQLKTFRNYAENLGQEKIRQKYDGLYNLVQDIYKKRKKDVKDPGDRDNVYYDLKRNLRHFE